MTMSPALGSESTMPAGRFKAVCLKLLDEVAESRSPVTITKRGRPVARLVPVSVDEPVGLFGALAATVSRYDDLIAPIDDEWHAQR